MGFPKQAWGRGHPSRAKAYAHAAQWRLEQRADFDEAVSTLRQGLAEEPLTGAGDGLDQKIRGVMKFIHGAVQWQCNRSYPHLPHDVENNYHCPGLPGPRHRANNKKGR